jgi:hypothetical protein
MLKKKFGPIIELFTQKIVSKESRFLLLFLLDDRRIRIRTSDNDPDSDPGGLKTYGSASLFF